MGRIWLTTTSGVAPLTGTRLPPAAGGSRYGGDLGLDGGVLEVEARGLHRGRVGHDGGLRRVGVGLELVELLLGGQVVSCTSCWYRVTCCRAFTSWARSLARLACAMSRAAWKGRGSIWKSKLPGLDLVALLEGHLEKGAAHLAPNRDRLNGRHRADGADFLGHRALLDRLDRDGHRGARRRGPCGRRRRRAA